MYVRTLRQEKSERFQHSKQGTACEQQGGLLIIFAVAQEAADVRVAENNNIRQLPLTSMQRLSKINQGVR